jgi:hypothetical protein
VVMYKGGRKKCCWMSYEHVDLISLVSELYHRRQVQSSKRLAYLRVKELEERARIEKERAARAAQAARAEEAKKARERAAKGAARAAQEAALVQKAKLAAERAALIKKAKERKAEEASLSKEMQRVLAQHQVETIVQNSSFSPDIQTQIRNSSLSKLRIIADGLKRHNFPMNEQQLSSLLESSEKAALETARRNATSRSTASNVPSRQSPGIPGTTNPTNRTAASTVSTAGGDWSTKVEQPRQSPHTQQQPNGANRNNFNMYQPNAMHHQYTQSNARNGESNRLARKGTSLYSISHLRLFQKETRRECRL